MLRNSTAIHYAFTAALEPAGFCMTLGTSASSLKSELNPVPSVSSQDRNGKTRTGSPGWGGLRLWGVLWLFSILGMKSSPLSGYPPLGKVLISTCSLAFCSAVCPFAGFSIWVPGSKCLWKDQLQPCRVISEKNREVSLAYDPAEFRWWDPYHIPLAAGWH